MRGSGIQEPRYRQSGLFKRTLRGMGPLNPIQRETPEKAKEKKAESKHFTWKSPALRIAILTLFAFFFLTILFPPFRSETESPSTAHNARSSYGDRKGFSWVWNSFHSSNLYDVKKPLDWSQIDPILASLKASESGGLKIGLVNFPKSEDISHWKAQSDGGLSVINFPFEYVSEDLKWEELYPEWIDEEEKYEAPKCPSLPMPQIQEGTRLNLIVAKVPCQKPEGKSFSMNTSSMRDIVRLHVHLIAAKLAISTEAMNILLISACQPIPNLFTCKELFHHHDGVWLFKADLRNLKKKLSLPVGSCELAVPLESEMRVVDNKNTRREAYATILHSAADYVCGAIAVARSIRMTGSTRDLVILVDENIKPDQREGLTEAGWLVKEIQRIRNPKAKPDAYNEWNYSKFRLWQLTEYDKVIFIDADMLILRNIDFLFELPEISATGNDGTLFNSGVMVVEPSECTFKLLMDRIDEVVSYNGGDQGYLNEVFTWWHRLPKRMNYLKHFWINDTEEYMTKTRLFGAENPSELYVLHYLGLKPWLCFRDYDCSWNVKGQRGYASDVAHARWWKVHDGMTEKLQTFCLLKTKRKAALEWDRKQAEAADFPDEHWKRNITDNRLHICHEIFCFWESMLWHWGDPNYNQSNPTNKTGSLSS